MVSSLPPALQTFSYGDETYLVDKRRDYRFRNVHVLLHEDGTRDFETYGKKVLVSKLNPDRTEIIEVAA